MRQRSIRLLVLTAITLPGLLTHATVSSGINCTSCHSNARNSGSLVDFTEMLDLGNGPLPVYEAQPGTAVNIATLVDNASGSYALNFNIRSPQGLNDPANLLTYTPDTSSTWTERTRGGTYYTTSTSSSNNRTYSFSLGIAESTPPDVYMGEVQIAGRSSNRYAEIEQFYIRVLGTDLVPPEIANPSRNGNQFTCQVATSVGATYRLEFNTSLSAEGWVVVDQATGDDSTRTLSHTPANPPTHRFYRIRVE